MTPSVSRRRAIAWCAVTLGWHGAACAGLPLERLSEGFFLVAAHTGDANERNRGVVSNLAVARDAQGLWVIGSGPSPVFGRLLHQHLRQRWPTDAIELFSPWAHPESVLGVAGVRHARHWAHEEVAQQMAQRCPGCLMRLAARMGAAAADLELQAASKAATPGPIRIPDHVLRGESGAWGPFDWHRFQRAPDVTVIVLRHRASGVVFAPGLLWGDAPPDGRDADTQVLSESLENLAAWGRRTGATQWLGQQGASVGPHVPGAAARYWRQLEETAAQGQERGDDGLLAPQSLNGVPERWLVHPHHTLNWQRAWRQAESRWLQRSLR